MALINIDLTEAETKLVQAVTDTILPQITNEVTNQIIPSLRAALVGLHFEVKVTCDISKNPPCGPPTPIT